MSECDESEEYESDRVCPTASAGKRMRVQSAGARAIPPVPPPACEKGGGPHVLSNVKLPLQCAAGGCPQRTAWSFERKSVPPFHCFD